ncbi:hypothetical protein DVT68_16775 [Dyella solisilvae]|uniref:DUF2189 domain-containing protein n=1 Tax=Dyella solisilvae TaxID=1920168 RepID=A0A370K437_9GAMM|nr:hypothetical protein [Dyella solisilvae]RDI97404.1 hypothetical protein DVT68_16775 [Dyella solisilvae]
MEALAGTATVVLPARRALHWCAEGLRLWRRYPLRLFVLSLAPLVLESVLQAIPLVGVALSKMVVPLLGFGLLQGLVDAERNGSLLWSSPFSVWKHGYRWRAMGLGALMGLIIVGTQQSVVAAIYGWPAVDAVLLGHVRAHPALLTRGFVSVLVLTGIPLTVLFGMAPMLLMFRGALPWAAVSASVRMCCRHLAPFALYTLLQMVVMGGMLAAPFGMLAVLLWAPWMTACWYVIWKDIEILPGGT